jgi:hypothetical protein
MVDSLFNLIKKKIVARKTLEFARLSSEIARLKTKIAKKETLMTIIFLLPL